MLEFDQREILKTTTLSPRRRPGLSLAAVSITYKTWIPAFAGTTEFLEVPQREFNVRRLPTFLNRHFSNEQSRVESASIRPPVLAGR